MKWEIWKAIDGWTHRDRGIVVGRAEHPNDLVAFIDRSLIDWPGDPVRIARRIADDPSVLDDRDRYLKGERCDYLPHGTVIDLRGIGLKDQEPVPGFVYGLKLVPLDGGSDRCDTAISLTPYCHGLFLAMKRDLERRKAALGGDDATIDSSQSFE